MKLISYLLFFTVFILSPVAQGKEFSSQLSCSGKPLWMARKSLLEMISFEALRYARIKMGLYPEWTGPQSPELTAQCDTAAKALDSSGEGSVLFTGLDSDLYRTIASFSDTWVSHTGVAMHEGGRHEGGRHEGGRHESGRHEGGRHEGGQWVVYESRAPSGLDEPTPLCDFIRRSTEYRVAIAKPKVQLNDQQLEELRDLLKQKLGQAYDYTFNMAHPEKQFCSKFVYEAYANFGLQFGTPVTLKELYDDFDGATAEKEQMVCFFQAWFESLALSSVPWSQETLTPHSQYQSALNGREDSSEPFEIIYDSQDRTEH